MAFQDIEREMQLDLSRQLEQLNKEMDEQLMADLQVSQWIVFACEFQGCNDCGYFLISMNDKRAGEIQARN